MRSNRSASLSVNSSAVMLISRAAIRSTIGRPNGNSAQSQGTDTRRNGHRDRATDLLAEPVEIVEQSEVSIRQRRRVEDAATYGSPARARRNISADVAVHPRAHVKCRDAKLIDVRETETDQRIDNRERLYRLGRIEIIAFLFVADIEAGTDHRDATHGPDSANPPRTFRSPQCLLYRKIDPNGGVRGQTSPAIQSRSLCELETRIAQRRAPPPSAARRSHFPSLTDRSSTASAAALEIRRAADAARTAAARCCPADRALARNRRVRCSTASWICLPSSCREVMRGGW